MKRITPFENASIMTIFSSKKIMLKNFLIICSLFISGNLVHAQQPEPDPYYINLFVNKNKIIYIGQDKTDFEHIEKSVVQLIRNKPFQLDQPVVYRIFADKNLKMGYIIDLTHQMISAYSENVHVERYLINAVELNIDGQNWFDSVDLNAIEEAN